MIGEETINDLLDSTEADRVLALSRRWCGRLYAVLDAAREPTVLEFLHGSGLRYESLFDGWARTVMATAAPYLVALPRNALATRRLVERGWGRAWGVLLVSSVGFAETRRQLRRLLTVRIPGEAVAHFRFYDPRLLPAFLASCGSEERAQVFGRIEGFLCEDSSEGGGVHALDRGAEARAESEGAW